MAFETIDSWHVERRWGLPSPAMHWSPQISVNIPFQEQIEKMPSMVLAIGLNGAFLYFLITSAFDLEWEKPAESSAALKATMTMMNLENADKETELQPKYGGSGSPAVLNFPPSDLDATVENKLPPEWSVRRIRVARVKNPTSDVNAGTGAVQGVGIGTGSSKGTYDPFAGAAPNREPERDLALKRKRTQPSIGIQVAGYLGFGEDNQNTGERQSFKAWVEGLKRRLPRARGSIELSVSMGPDGTVKSAKILGGSASMQIKFFVRNAVVGERFDDVGWKGPRSTQLPVVRLG